MIPAFTLLASLSVQAPLVESGSVSVAGVPRTGGGCEADRPPLPIATFALGDASGAPGTAVRVPFIINAKAEARGSQFSVDFDEEVLQAGRIESVFRLPDGTTDYDFASLTMDNSNAVTDEGFLLGGVIFSMGSPAVALPPERDNEVLAFHFQVNPGASTGTSTEVRFLEFNPRISIRCCFQVAGIEYCHAEQDYPRAQSASHSR